MMRKKNWGVFTSYVQEIRKYRGEKQTGIELQNFNRCGYLWSFILIKILFGLGMSLTQRI